MYARHLNDGLKVTEVSVIPCRLNDGLHEWRNEIPSVPNLSPPNTLYWCEDQ